MRKAAVALLVVEVDNKDVVSNQVTHIDARLEEVGGSVRIMVAISICVAAIRRSHYTDHVVGLPNL